MAGLATAAIALTAAGSPAGAQTTYGQHPPLTWDFEPVNIYTVLTRPRDDYDPIGVDLDSIMGSSSGPGGGTFVFYPQLTVRGGYDDNVFRQETGEVGSFFTVARPSIIVQSDWVNHGIQLGAWGRVTRHESAERNDSEDWEVHGTGFIDVTDELSVYADGRHGMFGEEREDPASPAGATNVTDYFRTSGTFGVNWRPEPLLVSLEGEILQFNFNDNGPIDNDDRDRLHYKVTGRVAHEIIPDTYLFTQGSYNWVNYDEPMDNAGFQRDSEGFEVQVGVQRLIEELVLLELRGGYFRQTFDDPAFGDASGFSLAAEATWNPTDWVSLRFHADSGYSESNLDATSGARTVGGGMQVEIEAKEDLLFVVGGNYTNADFLDLARIDDNWRFYTEVVYLINEYFSITGSYSYTRRDSTVTAEDFSSNRILISIDSHI